jgi:hypothetical protein
MMRTCLVALVAGLTFAGIQARAAADSATPPSLGAIAAGRAAIARNLVEPVVRCVRRKDTDHVAFHGCIDWHSSVHGTLALVIYGGMTGDQTYDSLVKSELTAPKIAREQTLLRTRPGFEMPYGRSWFLRLATQYQARFGDGVLRDMAKEVADSLRLFISRRPSDLYEGAYSSLSWALINLIDYAEAAGDGVNARFAREYARAALLRSGPYCDYGLEHSEFMSICLQRAWLASKVLGREEFERWQQEFLDRTGLPQPVTDPNSAHHYGLNFSRSWALAALHRATRRPDYARAYAAHFWTGYSDRQNWDGRYETVAHWVAQFGMLSLFLLGTDAPALRQVH